MPGIKSKAQVLREEYTVLIRMNSSNLFVVFRSTEVFFPGQASVRLGNGVSPLVCPPIRCPRLDTEFLVGPKLRGPQLSRLFVGMIPVLSIRTRVEMAAPVTCATVGV